MRPRNAHPRPVRRAGPRLAPEQTLTRQQVSLPLLLSLALALALVAAPLWAFPGLRPAAERPRRESAAPLPGPALEMLNRAWEAAGDRLEQALLFLQEPVEDPQVAERLAAGLGWGADAPTGEERSLRLVDGIGGPYVEVTWRLRGEAAARWDERYRELRQTLAAEGLWPQVQVELSGRAAGGQPLALAGAALDALGARQREPWSDGRAASVAGYTPLLPPGPYAVNVQAAVRRDGDGDGNRLWIGWPTVRSDY
ncbi:YwmB family TATA-box binding protein [Symbiobacterium thermophilum]|uniref:Uncharacterized protein n=1 Tax=Symbiobacterium thermophilum TaxID=2734 RepID=A0A953LK06_SYMTR|nr:YwmB family TATA-box binding protein [Symbiobacterium thermophilum]MBY6276472.1 hypothetical protein [Symbiobacterium thermophilum]